MPTDLIRYDLLVQDALRSVVRDVLADVAREGLPGEHHFCITFKTHAPGVRLSSRVRDKHPDELTIILQHQFSNLLVTDQAFEVSLSFGSVPERLTVPFDSITGFWDPSVQFGLKFEIQDTSPQDGANDSAPPLVAPSKTPAKSAAKVARMQEVEAEAAATSKPAKAGHSLETKPPAPEPSHDEAAKVVSIDAFRKKT